MPQHVDVIVERESANDTDGTVIEVFFTSGSPVKAGERIFDIETSKAVQEIYAQSAGILVHALAKDDKIALGAAIARIVPEGAEAVLASAPTAPAASQPAVPAVVPRQGLPRLSRAAAALAAQHGLTASDFDRDLVVTADVMRRAGVAAAASAALPQPAPTSIARPASEAPRPVGQPVASHKQHEIDLLSRGAGASMLSVVGATIGHGDLQRADGGFFTGKIVDLVAYEASRLMKDHPKLNAAWRDGSIEYHEAVHAGIAFDNSGRLAVYGVENADTLDLEELQDEIFDGFRKYIGNKLTARELTRATFTITDLSATGVDYVLPLLPHGQSCILGITNGSHGFALHLGFDHRVTEGLDASRFLSELRKRTIAALGSLDKSA